MIFDAVILAVLLISAVIAFFRGLIREALTILGIVGGLAAAFYIGPVLAVQTRKWLSVEEGGEARHLFDIIPYSVLADLLAYGGIFILVVIILSIASHFLAKGASAVGLGPLDRTLGVIFGLLRGIILLGILYLPIYILIEEETRDEWFSGSHTRIYVEKTSGWMAGFIPSSMTEEMDKKADEAASSLSQDTREKLKELEVLRSREKLENAPPERSGAQRGTGYQTDQRQQMDRLIQEEAYDEQQ